MIKNGFYQDIFGQKFWLKNGAYHRINGPARIYYVSRYYYEKDILHRLNGPISTHYHGEQWYINGINITMELILYCDKHHINIDDYMNLKFSDKLKLKFKFGLIL